MDAAGERGRIRELELLRRQMRYTRWGFLVVLFAIVVWSLFTLNRSARALAYEGPDRDVFTQSLRNNLDKDVIPRVRSAASETLTEIQPEVKAAINHLGTRMPEMTQMVRTELQALQNDLPKQGETVLNSTYVSVLNERQAKIKSMYPDVTDEQVRLVVANLSEEGHRQVLAANEELFAPHQQKLKSILANLESIKSQESKNVKNIQPSWDMAILLLDILREDLKSMQGADTTQTQAPKAQLASITTSKAVK